MITSLRCQNFKCFYDTDNLELAPITLLVGENNSGKSSIIQALHLPALTLQSEDPGVCLKLLHQDYDYGSFRDLVFQHDENRPLILSYGMKTDITRVSGKKLRSRKMKAIIRLTYGYLARRKEICLDQFDIIDSRGIRLSILQDRYTNSKKVFIRKYQKESKYLARFFKREGFFYIPRYSPFNSLARMQRKYGKTRANAIFTDFADNFEIISKFASSFRKINLLGPIRVPPRRTYLSSGELSDRIGPKGELALQNYAALLKRRRKEDFRKVKSIKEAFRQLGFIKNFDIKQIVGRYYEFWTQHKDSILDANLADTGFGASQVLPVIVSLYTSPPGCTLLFEQPEIHLHPAAQAELGSVFVKACKPENRIVIETHSENLILRIQTEVAKGNLKPEDVRFYYVKPDLESHRVIPIPVDRKGNFLAEWPKGFFEENYQESLKLAKARQGG